MSSKTWACRELPTSIHYSKLAVEERCQRKQRETLT